MNNKLGKYVLLVLDALSICILGYVLYRNITTDFSDSKALSDLLQAVLMVVIFSTALILMIKVVDFSNAIIICGSFTVVAHFLLGEILEFYVHINNYDSLLHLVNSTILTFAVFSIFCNHYQGDNTKGQLVLKSISGLGIAMLVGVFWEFFEFYADTFSDGNMQRTINSITGEPFVGKAAIRDTMKDLILDFCGGIIACSIYYAMARKEKRFNEVFGVRLKRKGDK